MRGVSAIEFLLIIMTMLLLGVGIKHIWLKKEIRNVSKQIEEQLWRRSEKMLDISLIDNDLEHLAGTLNQYNECQRQIAARAIRHEKYLKESIANVSHDLRTPLTVIMGHLQLLKKENLTNEHSQRIVTVFNKAEKMKELIETFYDLAVLDTEQTTPLKERFNFSNLLIDLITENSLAFEQRKICPEISLPEYSVFLFADPHMVERILQNLLTNAIRYSSGTVNISLSQTDNKQIIFSIENPIRDNLKLDPDRLFDRFYTGDQSRHNGSSGLGLAVVKLLTEKLGGKVTATIHEDILRVQMEIE